MYDVHKTIVLILGFLSLFSAKVSLDRATVLLLGCVILFHAKYSSGDELMQVGNQTFVFPSTILRKYVQGEHSGCVKPPVDIKTKV